MARIEPERLAVETDPQQLSPGLLYFYVWSRKALEGQPYADELFRRLLGDPPHHKGPISKALLKKFRVRLKDRGNWLNDAIQSAWAELLPRIQAGVTPPPGLREWWNPDSSDCFNVAGYVRRAIENACWKELASRQRVPRLPFKDAKPLSLHTARGLYIACGKGSEHVENWFYNTFRKYKPHPLILLAHEFYSATNQARLPDDGRRDWTPERLVHIALRDSPKKLQLNAHGAIYDAPDYPNDQQELDRRLAGGLAYDDATTIAVAANCHAELNDSLVNFARLDKALSALRKKDRDIIQSHHVDKLSHAEIATQDGIKEDTARQRYKRAIDALKAQFSRLEASSVVFDANTAERYIESTSVECSRPPAPVFVSQKWDLRSNPLYVKPAAAPLNEDRPIPKVDPFGISVPSPYVNMEPLLARIRQALQAAQLTAEQAVVMTGMQILDWPYRLDEFERRITEQKAQSVLRKQPAKLPDGSRLDGPHVGPNRPQYLTAKPTTTVAIFSPTSVPS